MGGIAGTLHVLGLMNYSFRWLRRSEASSCTIQNQHYQDYHSSNSHYVEKKVFLEILYNLLNRLTYQSRLDKMNIWWHNGKNIQATLLHNLKIRLHWPLSAAAVIAS